MIADQSVLALIAARGGSKGVPGKNVRELAGRPLIAWTVANCLACRYVDRVIVSTDDERIAAAARAAGAETPFMRPAHLASDTASNRDAVLHALDFVEAEGRACALLLQPQATSPLTEPRDLEALLETLIEKKAGAAATLCESAESGFWINTLPPDGCLKDFVRPEHCVNRQALPPTYVLNGAAYAARWDYFRAQGYKGERFYASLMPRERSVDIDTELDFRIAELLMHEKLAAAQRKGSGAER